MTGLEEGAPAQERQALGLLPLVVTELIAMVICRDDVDEQDVLGLGVHARDFHLVAGEHPPEGGQGLRRHSGRNSRVEVRVGAEPF